MSEFTVVVANGVWPSENIMDALIEKSDFVIALDGAADRFSNWDIVVGDMDSIENADAHEPDTNPENSDLAKALIKYDVDAIVGIDGGRLDHRLGAFSSLFETKSDAILYFDEWRACRVGSEGLEIELEKGTKCAIFAFGSVYEVSLNGTVYELEKEDLASGTRGIGNQSVDELITISHTGGDLLFIWEANAL